jgi:hypothetical protein
VDDTKVPATNADGQAVDSTGDTIAVLIGVKGATYKQAAIRLARTVTTKKVTASNISQVSSVKASSWLTSPTVASYTDLASNTQAKLVWTSEPTVTYFKAGEGNGLDLPWGFGTMTTYTGTVKGKVQAHHFLGDKGYPADCTKVWCIEKDNDVEVLFYEFVDRNGGAAATSWILNDVVRWDVKTFKVKGANQLALAATAMLAALSVLSF